MRVRLGDSRGQVVRRERRLGHALDSHQRRREGPRKVWRLARRVARLPTFVEPAEARARSGRVLYFRRTASGSSTLGCAFSWIDLFTFAAPRGENRAIDKRQAHDLARSGGHSKHEEEQEDQTPKG